MIQTRPQLSVVVPLHNEEGNVRPLFHALCTALEPLGRSFEVLLVNDGSTDATGELLDALAASDARLRPIHLDGNFGQAAALSAGFEHAEAPIILTLDGDLQNDPADLTRVLALLEEGGYRVVSGWRRKRKEGYALRVLPSRIANWLISSLTGLRSRDNGCSLKAYRSEVVKGTYLPHGMHRFLPAVYGVRASEFAELEVTHKARVSGRSHYGLSRIFPVVRDLLAIRYLIHKPGRAVGWMSLLAAAGGAGVAASLLLLATGSLLGGAGLALGSGLVLAYALAVRANLLRWQRAQREKTFRVRRAAEPLPAELLAVEAPRRARA